SLVFAILLSSVRGPGLWNVVIILALVFWSRYSRAVRGEVLTLRERDFVKLAEINGIGKLTIIRRHLIPNVMNTVMVLFSLQVGVAVIIEASLSFLGVGVPPPEPSWGLMMAQERESLMEGRWWLGIFPGTCITLLVLSAKILGDWLRAPLGPRLPHRRGVAGAQGVPSTSRPILSGPLAKLDIKDALIEAGRGAPKGALRIGLHFGIDPGWFDPLGYYGAAHQFFYLMHDALIKPMPQGEFTYSLAERAEMSADYRRAAFRLRPGLKFHDGHPLTTADGKGPYG